MLQLLGGLIVTRIIARASPVYGFFTLVIVLLTWLGLYRQDQFLLAMEVDAVRVNRLGRAPWCNRSLPAETCARFAIKRKASCARTSGNHGSLGGGAAATTAAPRRPGAGQPADAPDCNCPRRWAALRGATIDELEKTGKVTANYYMLSFLGPQKRAANAAGCAQDQGKFKPFYDYLYAHQPPEKTGRYTTNDLIAAGRAVGITSPAFDECVTSMKYQNWVTNVNDAAAEGHWDTHAVPQRAAGRKPDPGEPQERGERGRVTSSASTLSGRLCGDRSRPVVDDITTVLPRVYEAGLLVHVPRRLVGRVAVQAGGGGTGRLERGKRLAHYQRAQTAALRARGHGDHI